MPLYSILSRTIKKKKRQRLIGNLENIMKVKKRSLADISS